VVTVGVLARFEFKAGNEAAVEQFGRLPELLFSRRLIDVVFRVCRDPATVAASAKKLPALRSDCETKAHEILRA
jgi:hypothetical protein